MKLIAPKSIKVKKRRVPIFQHTYVTCQGEYLRGAYEHGDGIHLAKRMKIGLAPESYEFTYKDQHETLWHEITHAILHEMGRHKLNKDEKFVTEFAKTLSDAILSAKF
jgi:predicted SprT family Zn-dependent metalloprotease